MPFKEARGPRTLEPVTDDIIRQMLDFTSGDTASLRVFFAPGRVNLIGEHTDYNGGYVLPAALELGTWLFVRPRKDGVFRFATTFAANVVTTTSPAEPFRSDDGFANYPKGVIWAMDRIGVGISGADFFFHGNLPSGSGLSSSASVEVVTAAAVNVLSSGALLTEQLAILSQQAENEYVGVNSGIMDQFAVAMGKRNCALSLHCATLDYSLVPFEAPALRLLIANTNTPHALVDSKYNERRQECEEALRILQGVRPDLTSLADVTPAIWPTLASSLPSDLLRRRARHVVFENARALAAVELMRRGEFEKFGQSMVESHISLRDDYEVTGTALDALAEAAWSVRGCLGSRMTGAGFGGCTVSLVQADSVEAFQSQVSSAYEARIGRRPSFYITKIGDGVREVTQEVFPL